MSNIFATESAAALAFVASVEMGMSAEEAHELVYGQPSTPCPPAAVTTYTRSPEEPPHVVTFGGVYVNYCLMGDNNA